MGPCILTAPALTPPLPPDHASVPRQGTGLPQRKLTPPASCGGPPYTPHTPPGSWGGGGSASHARGQFHSPGRHLQRDMSTYASPVNSGQVLLPDE